MLTLVPIGGTLLFLAGVTIAETIIGLAVSTPLFVIFSPVLVPAALGPVRGRDLNLGGFWDHGPLVFLLVGTFSESESAVGADGPEGSGDYPGYLGLMVQETAGYLGHKMHETGGQVGHLLQETGG